MTDGSVVHVTRRIHDGDSSAERFHPEDVAEEIRLRLLEEAKHRGDFSRLHPCPASYNEVVDEPEAKLVILGPGRLHNAKDATSPTRQLAAEILNRGSAGRNCGNMLVFLAADKTRFADLDKSNPSLPGMEVDRERESAFGPDSIPGESSRPEEGKFGSGSQGSNTGDLRLASRARTEEARIWPGVP